MNLIGYLRQKFVKNKVKVPSLYEKALDLGLHPQPWWNASFYEWAIDQEEIRREEERRGGDEE